MYRDVTCNAIPAALARIPAGHVLIIETHLFEIGLLRHFDIQPEYEEFKPGAIPLIASGIAMWMASIIRFILRKGWDRPHFHDWYRLTIVNAKEK